MSESLEVVSHEQGGRVLSGVGVTADALAETMDRHTPDETQAEAVATATSAAVTPEIPKPTRGQKRFSELSQAAKDAAARADAAERERDELKARLAQPPVAEPQRQQAPQVAATAATRTKPVEDEIGTKYQTHSDFMEDLADWKVEQRLSAMDLDARVRQGIEADRSSRSFNDLVERTRAKGRDVYADFDTVMTTGTGSQIPLGRTAQEAMERAQFVINHPQSEHLQYAIMKDGVLAQKLASLPAMEFGLELARIAPSSAAVSPASTAGTGSVIAPAPYQPVGSGTKTTVTPSADLVKRGFDFDKSGYRERRAAERGVKRRP